MRTDQQMGLTMIHLVLYPEGLVLLCGRCQRQILAPMRDRKMVALADLVDQAQAHVAEAHHTPSCTRRRDHGGSEDACATLWCVHGHPLGSCCTEAAVFRDA